MDKYDPLNYAVIPAKIITGKAGLSFDLRSSLLRIRWRIVTPNRNRQLEVIGEVRVDRITPFGVLPTKRFQLLQSLNSELVQFLDIPLEDNLPYKITFINNDPLVTKSSIEVAEYIPFIPQQSLADITGDIYPSDNYRRNRMSSVSNPIDNSALVQAIATSGQHAPMISDQDILSVPSKIESLVGLIPPNDRLRKISVTNAHPTASIKLSLEPIPVGMTYAALNDFYKMPLLPGGDVEITDPDCRAGLWAIANLDKGSAPMRYFTSRMADQKSLGQL